MYLLHFGLRELPFTLTPNTNFYVDLESHREALQVLTTAIKSGEGFIKVTGEVGTGKTLICRKILNEIPEDFVTAYIPNPYLSPNEMRVALGEELGIEDIEKTDQHHLTQKIQKKLIELTENGKAVVLLVDEAQALPIESLEALRLFTNLETERKKLLQVVLFGQPELDQKLEQPEIRQLKQRITFSYQLRKLTTEEIAAYIQYRMLCAGNSGTNVFPQKVVKQITVASRGVPRLVNILCHKALMLAYGNGRKSVTTSDLKLAIKDTEDTLPNNYYLTYALVATISLLFLSLIFIAMRLIQ
jgi:MSHA biogenesis protein MshM